MGRRRVKGGESINSSRGAPLAPCSVCIASVGMIVGAETGHCPSWIFLSIEKRWMEGRKRRRQGDRKRVRV